MNGSQEKHNESGNVSSADIQATADDLLVHGMLQGRLQDSPQDKTRRVKRVCRSLKPGRVSFWRAYWKVELWATAAVLGLLLGLWQIPGGTPAAYAGFEEVLISFESGDKMYTVDILAESPDSSGGRPGRGGRVARHLDGAVIYIRGTQAVLEYQGSRGWGVTRGNDGRESWVVLHHRRQSWISRDSGRSISQLPDYVHGLMVMDWHGILGRIKQDYRLTGDSRSENGHGTVEVYTARRRPGRPELPEWIRIEFNRQTRQVQSIVCGGLRLGKRRGHAQSYTLEMRLTGTNPLPSDWFTREAHLRSKGG